MLRTITLGRRSLRATSLIRTPLVWVVSAARSKTVCQLPCVRQRSWLSSSPSYSTSTNSTTTTSPSTPATHCPGCGAPFQQSQPDQPGYLVTPSTPTTTPIKKRKPTSGLDHASYASLVEALDPATRALLEGGTPADALNQDDMTTTPDNTTPSHPRSSTPICQRCHQLTHHHTRANEPGNAAFLRSSQQYSSLVSFLRTKRQPLLIYVMDATDMPWSIDALQQLVNDNNNNGARVIVVANKVDLLPSRAIKHHDQRIRDSITKTIRHTLGSSSQQQHNNTIEAVHLVSAKKGWGVKTLIKRLQHHMLPTDDVYVVGSVNAGKSALIQQLLNHARTLNKHHYKPTSSAVPGTTLGLVRIPLHILGLQQQQQQQEGRKTTTTIRDHFLIDTPGLIMASTAIHKQQQQQPMRPVTFRLHAHQSLILGQHQARIDVLDTQHPILMTFFSSTVAPHITKTAKLIDAAASAEMHALPKVVTVQSHALNSSQAVVDLAFAGGLGWVALTGAFGRASLRIWLDPALPPTAFALRDPPFMPFEFRGQVRKFFGSGERAIQ